MPAAKPFTLADLPRVIRRKRRSPANVWADLGTAMNPAFTRPKPAPDIEVRTLLHRSGEPYTMIRNPRAPAYIKLNAEERFIYDLMDGTRTIRDIVVAHFQQHGRFALSLVTGLIEDLRRTGFLVEQYVSVEEKIAEAKLGRGPRFVAGFRRLRKRKRVEMRRAHERTDWIYRHGGRLAYTKTANAIFVGITGVGLVAMWRLFEQHRFTLFGRTALSVLSLYLIDLLATFIHEGGHALTTRHFSRRVNAAGFMFYLGMPMFFIETTDMWMADRRARILSSWAGPYSGFIIGGACSIAAALMPVSALSAFLFRFAIFTYYGTLQNLVPFLRLDGYYILMDAIDTQNLRERSFEFVRRELQQRIRGRNKLTREESLLAGYGLIASFFAVVAVLLSIAFWTRVFKRPVIGGWHGGWPTRLLVIGLLGLLLSPVVRALLRLGNKTYRAARFGLRRARAAAQRGWRREAASMFSALPLLGDMDAESLGEISARVSLERVALGAAAVAEGETGTRFYLVRSGRFEVVRRSGDGSEIRMRALGRGESFGEIALLTAAPRSATVRAIEDSEVFVLDKGTFDRVLAGRMDAASVREALLSAEAVRALPPFAALDEEEAALVARSSEWVNVAPRGVIVRQGREADGFYVIASGQVEVMEGRRKVRELGPGAYFGEIALLLDEPRTATVRALTPCRLLRLDRAGFEKVLRRSFRRGSLAASAELVREWEH